MKCKRVREMMGAYLYGDLSPRDMKEVRLHAQECAGCREDLVSRGAVVSAAPCSVPEMSDTERQRLMWSVKGAISARERQERSAMRRLAPAFGVATVLALGLVVGSFVSSHSIKPPPAKGIAQKPKDSPVIEVKTVQPKETEPNPKETASRSEKSPSDGDSSGFRSTILGVNRSGTNSKRPHKRETDKPLQIAPETESPGNGDQDKPQKLPKPVSDEEIETPSDQ